MRVVLGAEQPEQDRQPNLTAAEARKLDDQDHHDPAVPPPGPLPGPLRLRAVVQVVRAPHLPARAAEQRVIDRQADRRARLDEHSHQEVQQSQTELVGIPAAAGEEVMRTTVMPHPSEPGGLQHPGHGAVPDPADHPNEEHAERLQRWLREATIEQGQQSLKRTGNLKHGGDPPVSRPRTRRCERPAADGFVAHRIRVAALIACSNSKPRRPAPTTPAITAPPSDPENPETRVRHIHAEKPSEEQLRRSNAAIAEVLVAGSGAATATTLGEIAGDKLSRTLTAAVIWQELARRDLQDLDATALRAAEATERWRRSVTREHLDPVIERAETATLFESLNLSQRAIVLLSGSAGSGKSGVAEQALANAKAAGWAAVGFRLDRQQLATTARQIGEQLDLPASPALTLAQAAQDNSVVERKVEIAIHYVRGSACTACSSRR